MSHVERNTNLTMGVGWVNIWTTNAPAGNGVFQFIDTFPDIANPPPASAFYRLQGN